VAFAPQVQRWPREETERSVREAARLLEIEPLLDRRIGGLSGGERQRVALARALVARPQVLVLDEPVSALDEPTREAVCGELRRLQRELGLTIVHVSHNLEEAFSVADRAAVMRAGRVEQVGRIDDLMRRPDNEAVARFMRCVNVFAGEAAGDGPAPGTTRVKADGFEFLVPGARRGRVVFVVRPENVLVRRTGEGAAGAGVAAAAARVTRSEDRGAYVRLQLESFRPLVAHLPAKAFAALGIRDGGAAEVLFPPDGVHVLPR
jgi:ABC-type Fe3+/spermidine/putrescine transport system ATPase subunit